MAAINPAQPPNPENSADKEARKLLAAHVRSGIKSAPARTNPSNGSVMPRKVAGSKRSGGGRISGGRG